MISDSTFRASAILMFVSALAIGQPGIERIEPNVDSGAAKALVITGPAPLVHTAMILPVDESGQLVGPDNANEQTARVLENLRRVLDASASSFDRVVRINVYAAHDDVIPIVESAFAETFAENAPAVTYAVGELALSGALVAVDAIAVADEGTAGTATVEGLFNRPRREHASILPLGRAVYVSGQAEPGETLAEATRNTMESLRATLEWLGLDLSHVVHVKTFMKPMAGVGEVDDTLDAFFSGDTVPPVTHVEWTNNTPIEIELIAFAPEGTATQAEGPVSYLTPPGMSESPVFCRVTVIDSKRRIYVSGLTGDDTSSAESEVRSLYAELGRILQAAGSDMHHLVKATYYCATDATSAALNQVRPDFYDPKRPPAASKALVGGTGRSGKGIAIDLIAVAN
ncbi:MAG: RidA family protein [Candidatus Hydrogenedentes bacterium]|nr:RidA family protein [Candidatus Hydrogenedentota bacterium]